MVWRWIRPVNWASESIGNVVNNRWGQTLGEFLRQLVDRVAAITQNAGISVDVGDGAAAAVGEADVERGVPGGCSSAIRRAFGGVQ